MTLMCLASQDPNGPECKPQGLKELVAYQYCRQTLCTTAAKGSIGGELKKNKKKTKNLKKTKDPPTLVVHLASAWHALKLTREAL